MHGIFCYLSNQSLTRAKDTVYFKPLCSPPSQTSSADGKDEWTSIGESSDTIAMVTVLIRMPA